MAQKLNTNKPGCPKRAIYGHLNFELQKKQNKYFALCLICSKMLSNIATKRLIAHRRCCPKSTNYDGVGILEETSIIVQNDGDVDSKLFLKDQIDPFKNTKHELTVKPSSKTQVQNEEWRTFRVGGKTKIPKVRLEDNHDYMEEITSNKKQRTSCDNDDVDFFFKSIAFSVKKFRPELINEAKLQALQMVFDLESKNNSAFVAARQQPPISNDSAFDNNIESILGER